MSLSEHLDLARLAPGFADPVHGAHASFRTILDALAHPGRIEQMPLCLAGAPPPALGPAAAAAALTLCDIDTPIWLDAPLAAAAAYLAFYCGSAITAMPAEACFAFVGDPSHVPPLDAFALGSDEYPDRSTTLVIEVASLTEGLPVRLAGPGIEGERRIAVAGLCAGFWAERARLAELFPRGLDILFTSGAALAALPRSTRIML